MIIVENCYNFVFVEVFLNCFDEIECNFEYKVLVIILSSEKLWSLGIDIDWFMFVLKIQKFVEVSGFMYLMDVVFKCLLLFLMLVIVVINGYVFGNGVILLCVCDFRFM